MAKAKEEKLLNEVTSGAIKVEGKGDGDPEGTPATAVAMLTTHWPKIEAMVRQNAKAMHEADMEKRASAEKLGEHWEVLYLDPYTRVETETKFLNPRAVVSLDTHSGMRWRVMKLGRNE